MQFHLRVLPVWRRRRYTTTLAVSTYMHDPLYFIPKCLMRKTSTWALAANGLTTKWKQLKQRTAWRYKKLKDDTAIIFSDAMHKQVQLKPRNRRLDDPMACHNVLAALSTANLNGILAATSPENSNQFCKTMVGFMLYSCTPSGRAKLLNLLTKERLNEISIPNRALVLRAI
ncbi:hypothetical protein PsorP6_019368 [Peronosclerospora sorghi]|nr:hypothetical protein PsorP6_019368 [Peronosclerospora sorghi]